MDEISLYEAILELRKPWFVEQVSFDKITQEVSVYIRADHDDGLKCPKCEKTCPGYDTRRRKWRHLDTCQFKTLVIADVPRVQCAEHGCLTVHVPWAEEYSRLTLAFEKDVIQRLQSASVLAVCRQTRLSWNAVDGVMRRAVARGQRELDDQLPARLCVDEVSIRKGHVYLTVVSEPSGRVIALEDGASKASLKRFYDRLSVEYKRSLEVISMDMSPAYIAVTLEEIPNAKEKIAFDHFHVTKIITKAVDGVRKQEMRHLHAEIKRHGLKGKRFHWLRNAASLSRTQSKELSALRAIASKTGRAWLLKEYARQLWHYRSRTWAEKAWKKWYGKAIRSRLRPIKTAARSIKKNLWGILNAIVLNANNGIAESINSKIKMLKVKCRGFRNTERFKTAIMFHCGGLPLNP